jgi:hypothetical protein
MTKAFPLDLISEMRARLEHAGALPALRDALGNYQPDLILDLQNCVVTACVDAQQYKLTGTDAYQKRRDSDRKVSKRISGQLKAIQKLQDFIQDHNRYVRNALVAMKLRNALSHSDDKDEDITESWNAVLGNYGRSLQKAIPAKQGPFLHRFQIGPLRYVKPVDNVRGKRPNAAEAGLLFQLVLYFRRFSHGEKNFAVILGHDEMPVGIGRPHYEVCAKLLGAALNVRSRRPETVRKRLEELLKYNEGISFSGWPHTS